MLKSVFIQLFLIWAVTALRGQQHNLDYTSLLEMAGFGAKEHHPKVEELLHSHNDDDGENAFHLLEAKHAREGILSASTIARINPFRDLDLYSSPDPPATFSFGKKPSRINLKFDPYYCDLVDYANIKNNENWLFHEYVINDYPFKKVLKFFDRNYEVPTRFEAGLPAQKLSHKATMFFLIKGNFSFFRKIGVEHPCYTQSYSLINGLQSMASKKGFSNNFFEYTEKHKNKPQCISSESFYPKTFLLDNAEQCKAFFNIIKSDEYQKKKKSQPLQYLIKISEGVDMGEGVFLFTQSYEDSLREKYDEGESCGMNKEKLLAQRYIHNPLLLDHKHKFDFRIHVLIASTNPVLVYYYDGLVRVSLQEYDIHSKDLKNHLTNVHVSQSIVKAERDPRKHKELLDYQVQSLFQFQDYLLREGYITDPNWVDNYLRPKFMKAIAHITKMTMHEWSVRSGIFRLLGADFMIDEDLNVWFIEINSGPLLFRTRKDVWENTQQMVKDIAEIEFGLLRSRMTRVSKFMKTYVKSCMLDKTDCDKEKWRKLFFKINIDKMDPEYAPGPENGWRLVADLGKQGKDAFNGLLDDSCFE